MQFKTLAVPFHVNIPVLWAQGFGGSRVWGHQQRGQDFAHGGQAHTALAQVSDPREAAQNLGAFPWVHERQTFPNKSLVARWFLVLQMVEKNSGEDMGGEASRIHPMKETSWNSHGQSLVLPFWRRCSKQRLHPWGHPYLHEREAN